MKLGGATRLEQVLNLTRPCTRAQILAEARRVGLTDRTLGKQLKLSKCGISRWQKKGSFPNQYYNAIVNLVIDAQVFGPVNGSSDYTQYRLIRRDGQRPRPGIERRMELSRRNSRNK